MGEATGIGEASAAGQRPCHGWNRAPGRRGTGARPPPTPLPAPPVALRAEVRLGAVRHNLRQLAEKAGVDGVVGVVKADAYGHGAVPVARVLVEEGVGWLAVATVPEAAQLREAGVEARVLVLAAPRPAFLPAYERHGLDVVVSSAEVARAVAAHGGGLRAHVKVDTGMHRLGLAPEEAPAVVRQLQAAPGVEVEALWTHLATADAADPSFALDQVKRFDGVLAALGDAAPPLVHVRNGPSLVRLPALTSRPALVRLGGVLYGLASDPAMTPAMDGLRPAMRLVADVVHLQTVPPARRSATGGRGGPSARRASPRSGPATPTGSPAPTPGRSGSAGGATPVVGRVCMDMLMVSLGEPGGPGDAVRLGDEAVLFGPGGPSAEAAAEAAGTMAYELTAGLTGRVARVYR